jgi:hypothetical protein
MQHKTWIVLGFISACFSTPTLADDVVTEATRPSHSERLGAKGDRIDARLDNKGERMDNRTASNGAARSRPQGNRQAGSGRQNRQRHASNANRMSRQGGKRYSDSGQRRR